MVEVRLLTGAYHGAGDWPPSPFRLFQALVAGAFGLGRRVGGEAVAALRWLESLPPPLIAAPPARPLAPLNLYVPSNDLDAKGGDPAAVSEIRVGKTVRPRLLAHDAPLCYLWRFDAAADPDAAGHAAEVARLAERLHTLGHGVDAACATARVIDGLGGDQAAAETLLAADAHCRVWHPAPGPAGPGGLTCPVAGSLDSLLARHAATRRRLGPGPGSGRKRLTLFTQPPKPLFAAVAYDCPPVRLLFGLMAADEPGSFAPWPLTDAHGLVVAARDGAARRLACDLPERGDLIKRVFGQCRDAVPADKAMRLRLIPLPSIGHPHVAPAIRRLLVEVPPDCPLAVEDLAWAFSGLALRVDPQTEKIGGPLLAPLPLAGERMPAHYGFGEERGAATHWHTVTPVALPVARRRGRIPGGTRAATEAQAAGAVLAALRHAGIAAPVAAVRVQREPFFARGARAEAFATKRFFPDRLWHVAITFAAPQSGPLVIGDGRYLGLGLLAPTQPAAAGDDSFTSARYVLDGEARPPLRDAVLVGEAMRRALMSLAGQLLGADAVPAQVHGHAPAGNGAHEHAFFLAEDRDGDGLVDHVSVHARRPFTAALAPLFAALTRLYGPGYDWPLRLEARGGAAVVAPAGRVWVSRTPYLHPWHRRPGHEVADQIRRELRLRGLPEPLAVTPLDQVTVGGEAVPPSAFRLARPGEDGAHRPDRAGSFWRLEFAAPLAGPLALGADCHFGLGQFAPA